MNSVRLAACLASLIAAPALRAQSIPGAVLAAREPHHHLAFEDSSIRVLRVHVAVHDSTLLHEHDPDYFWIALGTSSFVNARPGVADAVVAAPAFSVHYTPGRFAHVARNSGETAFDNITIELLDAQTNERNLCEPALAGRAMECNEKSGTIDHPAFETDQLHVGLITLGGGASARGSASGNRSWLVVLDTVDARALQAPSASVGGVSAVHGTAWSLRNRGRRTVRVLAITARR